MRKHCRRQIRPQRTPTLVSMAVKTERVFGPLEAILRGIAVDGTVDSYKGRACFRDVDGWWEAAPAVEGIVDYCEIASARHGWAVDIKPIRTLAKRLGAGVPLSIDDVSSARACIAECKAHAAKLTPDEAADILTTVQIQHRAAA